MKFKFYLNHFLTMNGLYFKLEEKDNLTL